MKSNLGGQRAVVDTQFFFGRNIRRLRLEQGMTQQEMADAVGVSRTQITNLEAGQCVFLATIGMIAEALKLKDASPLFDQTIPSGEEYQIAALSEKP